MVKERKRRRAVRGYFAGEDIAACEAAGITAFVPEPLRRGAAASNGRFAKETFIYDAATDTYRCPNGETLSLHGASTTRGHRLLFYYHPTACRRCPKRSGFCPT